MLLTGQRPDDILASTFTRKAAGEILGRILLRFAQAATDDARLAEFQTALGDPTLTRGKCLALLAGTAGRLHRLRISMLDSLFAQLAGSFALEIGLPPGCDPASDDHGWAGLHVWPATTTNATPYCAITRPRRGPGLRLGGRRKPVHVPPVARCPDTTGRTPGKLASGRIRPRSQSVCAARQTGVIGKSPPALLAGPAPDSGAKDPDTSRDDQAKGAWPAVIHVKLPEAVTMGAAFPVSRGHASLHLLGMGLDLFFDRHDSERAKFCRGRAAESLVRAAPFSFSPNPKSTRAAVRNKEGGGVLYCFLGGGVARGGAAPAAG